MQIHVNAAQQIISNLNHRVEIVSALLTIISAHQQYAQYAMIYVGIASEETQLITA